MCKNVRMYCSVPSYNFLWSDEDKKAGHYRRYGMSELIKKLSCCGFKIEYTTHIFSILPIPIFLMRTIPGMLRKSLYISDVKTDHGLGNSKLFGILWSWELDRIKKRKTIPCGGSCLVVGKNY